MCKRSFIWNYGKPKKSCFLGKAQKLSQGRIRKQKEDKFTKILKPLIFVAGKAVNDFRRISILDVIHTVPRIGLG